MPSVFGVFLCLLCLCLPVNGKKNDYVGRFYRVVSSSSRIDPKEPPPAAGYTPSAGLERGVVQLSFVVCLAHSLNV